MKIVDRIKVKIRGTINLEQLKKDGLKIGKNFNVQEGCIIDPGHCWLIKIGDNVTLAPNVHILAHDASTKIPLGYTKIGKVKIGNNVFIGAGSIILPGVTIGDNVIIGSMSLVTKNLKSNCVYGGNPCKKIMGYDEFVEKHKDKMTNAYKFDENYTISNIDEEKKEEMNKKLENGMGYIR